MDLTTFLQVQQNRAQRKQDLRAGINAVHASSWLGGIVCCGRCNGVVEWRTAQTTYACTGRSTPDGPGKGCGATWERAIEGFVQRALEDLLAGEQRALNDLVNGAVEQVPGHLDAQRQHAVARQRAADDQEQILGRALEKGTLPPAEYAQRIRDLHRQRAEAAELLTQVDGWSYLAQLIRCQEGPEGGPYRWVPISLVFATLEMPEKRRLLRAAAERITLDDPDKPCMFGENPGAGRFLWVSMELAYAQGIVSPLALGMARLLVRHPGFDVARGMAAVVLHREDHHEAHP